MFLKIESIDPYNLSIGETLLIAVVCMLIVFAMLALLWGIVALTSFLLNLRKQKNISVDENLKVNVNEYNDTKPLTMEDIKDEDMMVAALVATIEYHNEVKEDVRVVSIKELN